jgi:dipeptidyl aminopeptidase/acylaminoacyl peptidase
MVLCVFKLLVLFAAAGFTTISMAENEPLWLGEPAISPDGTKIAFRFEGQIWIVASAGGDATPLTPAGFHGTSSIWSPDGAMIALAANRRSSLSRCGDLRRLRHGASEPERIAVNMVRPAFEGEGASRSASFADFALSPNGKDIALLAPRMEQLRRFLTAPTPLIIDIDNGRRAEWRPRGSYVRLISLMTTSSVVSSSTS